MNKSDCSNKRFIYIQYYPKLSRSNTSKVGYDVLPSLERTLARRRENRVRNERLIAGGIAIILFTFIFAIFAK